MNAWDRGTWRTNEYSPRSSAGVGDTKSAATFSGPAEGWIPFSLKLLSIYNNYMENMCENYEKAKVTRTLPNCTCRECNQLTEEVVKKTVEASKAYDECLQRVKTSLMKKKIYEEIMKGEHDTFLYKFSEMLSKETSKSQVRFITISLDCTQDQIVNKVKICNNLITKLKFIPEDSQWVYEQRGESEEDCGKGLHIHLWMEKSKKSPFEITRDIAKPFGIAKNFVNVKTVPRSIAEKYMSGNKTESKMSKVSWDTVMRQKYSIAQIYKK